MVNPTLPQPRYFTIFGLLTWVATAAMLVAVLMPVVGTRNPILVSLAVVASLLLVRVYVRVAWYAMIILIVGTSWLFSIDRDFPSKDPIFPTRWWDFRPFLVIGVVAGIWFRFGLPFWLQERRWDDWRAVVGVTLIMPIVIIGFTVRHWLPAGLKPRPLDSQDELEQPDNPTTP